MRSKFTLILLLFGALFTMGAKLVEKPIEDFKSIAGTWKGGGVDWAGVHSTRLGARFPMILTIKEDGSFEIVGGIGTGTGAMEIHEGRTYYESPFGGGIVQVTLYQRKGKYILKAMNQSDGTTWQVKQAKKK